MKRTIIQIDEKLCDGCGLCIGSCAEGALKIISGKAKLVNPVFCDGLGACIGFCPQNAIKTVVTESDPYDEIETIKNILSGGNELLNEHLRHLNEHMQYEYLGQAVKYLKENNIPFNEDFTVAENKTEKVSERVEENNAPDAFRLEQWPIQMHLISPAAPQFKNSHFVLCADCAGYANPAVHSKYLAGKSFAIACPKLDKNLQLYIDKITALIDEAQIQSITILIMTVPCCGGLVQMVNLARECAIREVPAEIKVISPTGETVKEYSMNEQL